MIFENFVRSFVRFLGCEIVAFWRISKFVNWILFLKRAFSKAGGRVNYENEMCIALS